MQTTPTASNNADRSVLIIDNDAESVRILLETLAKRAIRGTVAATGKKALEYAQKNIWSIALINQQFCESFNEASCTNVIARLKTSHPEMPLVMLTTSDSSDTAQNALRKGYSKILVKPILHEIADELFNTFAPNHDTQTLALSKQDSVHPYKIVGTAPELVRTVEIATKVAPTSAPVLITGESGTGKELVAQLIHAESQRANAPFVKVNCAALNDSLLESELFGHEKGAFTGAGNQHKGRFERANGGTLLLDEITETRPQFQAKLLRVLENMNFERVGGNENINVNVRVISTTNNDILRQVDQNQFRPDLYYRLAAIKLAVPPLRNRKSDIVPLVWLFVNQFAHEAARPITSIDVETLKILREYHWPGNIRQLRNVVRTALILGDSSTLSLAEMPWIIEDMLPESTSSAERTLNLAGISLRQLERKAILATLSQNRGNQTKAAKALGISDRTLRDKIKKYRSQDQYVSIS